MKRNLPRRPNGTLDPITSFIVGAVSGTVAQTVAYPLDTIRRRVQVQEFFGTENLPVEQRYKGVLDAAWKITKYEVCFARKNGKIEMKIGKKIFSISLFLLLNFFREQEDFSVEFGQII